MGDKTGIEWTDATWNPIRGCARISPGCGGPNHQGGCYAEGIAARFSDPGQPFHGFAERTPHGGRWTGKLALIDDMLTVPLRWKRPRKIFVNSMSDLFHKSLPDSAIDKVFAVMALAPHHIFQPLTKRSDRARAYLSDPTTYQRILNAADALRRVRPKLGSIPISDTRHGAFWPHVWMGFSAEDQTRFNERWEDMQHLAEQGWLTWCSAEPLLGPIDISAAKRLRWLVAGGESGRGARPMHPDWARGLRDQCAAMGVPFLFKQWGRYAPEDVRHSDTLYEVQIDGRIACTDFGNPTGAFMVDIGKKAAGRELDGVTHDGYPSPGHVAATAALFVEG